MTPYDHHQWGVIQSVFGAIVAIVFGFIYLTAGRTIGPAVVFFAALVVSLIAFARLDTRVDGDGITWSFTFGIPGGHVDFANLANARVTQTNLLEGWGIHWTIWHGWLWNVQGFQAVELECRDGRDVTIGTDDPQGLLQAIERFRTDG